MKICRVCSNEIEFKNQLKYYNYPGIQKICKPCKKIELKKHNDKKYKTIKENPLWQLPRFHNFNRNVIDFVC